MHKPIPALLVAVPLFLSSCSSGGGAKALDLAPTLVSAVFIGAGATPVAGDRLRFQFSEDIELVAGTTLDAADVQLSGGSLGTIASAPVKVSARLVDVTLGSGVSLQPGVATVDFVATNDAVRDTTGNLVGPSTAVVITKGDGNDPAISNLTVNGIDSLTNGTGAAGGLVQVPPNGFTFDFTYSDASSTIDPQRTVITANVEVTVPSGKRAVGANLFSDLTGTVGNSFASLTVPAGVAFPVGQLQVTVQVGDSTGQVSAPVTFAFKVASLTNTIRPFETIVNTTQVWFIDSSRDIESYAVNLSQTVPVGVVNGTNGRPDLLDLFLTIGLQHTTPIANVQNGNDSNVVAFDLFKTQLQNELNSFFSGSPVTFTFTAPGTFPSGSGVVGYNSLSFSQICLAGSYDTAGSSGVLGLAMFDDNNQNQNNDCLTAFGSGSDRLGVFLHTIVNSGMQQPSVSMFRTTFDAFTPVRGGTPIGADANDGGRLIGTINDARASAIDVAIGRMARFAAVVVAHECGHSMGLVKDGAMPTGLYGNDANFSGSSAGHIRMPASVFPSGSTNIMSPSLSFSATQSANTAFNSLNRAYLREQVLYDL